MTLGIPVQAYRAWERVETLLLLLLDRLLGPVRFIQNGVVDTMLSPRTRAEDPAAVRMVRDCLVHADRAKLGNAVVSIWLRRPDLSRFLSRVSAPTLFLVGRQAGVTFLGCVTPSFSCSLVRIPAPITAGC